LSKTTSELTETDLEQEPGRCQWERQRPGIVPVSGSTQRTGVSGERGACFIEGEATSDLKGTDLVASLEIDTRPILWLAWQNVSIWWRRLGGHAPI